MKVLNICMYTLIVIALACSLGVFIVGGLRANGPAMIGGMLISAFWVLILKHWDDVA